MPARMHTTLHFASASYTDASARVAIYQNAPAKKLVVCLTGMPSSCDEDISGVDVDSHPYLHADVAEVPFAAVCL